MESVGVMFVHSTYTTMTDPRVLRDRAHKTLEEMMADRGYLKKENEEDVFDSRECDDRVKIYFCMDSKLNMDTMKTFVSDLQQQNIHHAILVHHHAITSSTKKLIEQLWSTEIETFHVDELQFNITRHVLYSKHEKANDLDPRVSTKPFPSILKTDAVVRYFNFKRHDVLRIFRKDGTISYRVVR